jgi:hypothetical protein
MLVDAKLREAIEEVNKHLPGKHDQETHAHEEPGSQSQDSYIFHGTTEFAANRILKNGLKASHSKDGLNWLIGSELSAGVEAVASIERHKKLGKVKTFAIIKLRQSAISGMSTTRRGGVFSTPKDIGPGAIVQVDIYQMPDRLPLGYDEIFKRSKKIKTLRSETKAENEAYLYSVAIGDTDEVEKHLPGLHDQLTHGHPGMQQGLTPEEYGVPAEYANAPEPNSIPAGKLMLVKDKHGEVVMGRATGKSNVSKVRALASIKALEKIYVNEQYVLYEQNGRYHIIQVGEGPVRAVITKEHELTVLGRKQPEARKVDPTEVQNIRKTLTKVLGLKKVATDYDGPSGSYIKAGNEILNEVYDGMMKSKRAYIDVTAFNPEDLALAHKLGIANNDEYGTDSDYRKATFAQAVQYALESTTDKQVLKWGLQGELARTAVGLIMTGNTARYDVADEASRTFLSNLDPRAVRHPWMDGLSFISMINQDMKPVKVMAYDPSMIGHGRSYYNDDAGTMFINTEDYRGGQTIVHEYGHHLENGNNALMEATEDFVIQRSVKKHSGTSVSPVPLRRLRGQGAGKQADHTEYAYKDKFINPYVGKYYGHLNGTEVASVGLEHMYYEPQNFLRQDPDHFAFILALMRGHK